MKLTDEMKAERRAMIQEHTPTIDERTDVVLEGVRSIIETKPKNKWMPSLRILNKEQGSPYDSDELKQILLVAQTEVFEKNREGCRALHGLDSISEAVGKTEKGSGYLIKYVVPKASFTLVGGAPKVGKTSILVAMLIRAYLGEEGVAGLRSKKFSHLTIYSDDQRPTDTGKYILAALQGLEDPEDARDKLRKLPLSIYPSLKLDDAGRDRLTEQAESMPGGVFVIDSLTSTAGKLGYDENSTEISRVVYDLRESIQSADPSATVILIHHMKKGGTGSNSQVDSFRGSSAITGAVDNIMTIERPQTTKGGNAVAQDMTSDRTIHLVGRTVGESKIVVRSDFNYVTNFDAEEDEETYSLQSIKLNYLCDAKDYAMHTESKPEEVKTHFEWLTDAQIQVLNVINSKKSPIPQKHIPGATSTNSKILKVLKYQTPPLIEEVEVNGLKSWKIVDDYDAKLKARITDPNQDY